MRSDARPKIVVGMRQRRVPLSCVAIRTFARWLMQHIPDFEAATWEEICIVVTGDAASAQTNWGYLQHVGPTDVITFSLPPPPGQQSQRGEIHVNAERAAAEAKRRRGNVSAELAFYIAHGFDHLCGHDDRTPRQRAAMHRRERAWLRAAGRAGLLQFAPR